MAFQEIRLPEDYSKASRGGPSWATLVAISGAGSEQRAQLQVYPRTRFTLDYDPYDIARFEVLLAFYMSVHGKLDGFRFWDWTDNSVVDSAIVLTGAGTAQMSKRYTFGAMTFDRKIIKPVSATVPGATELNPAPASATFKYNGSPLTISGYSTSTGIVTFNTQASFTVVGITKAANAVISVASNPVGVVQALDRIWIEGVLGMTQINNQILTVVSVDATAGFHIVVTLDTIGYGTYTSAGTVKVFPGYRPAHTVTWTGNFDLPARFDSDRLDVGAMESLRSGSLDVIELLL